MPARTDSPVTKWAHPGVGGMPARTDSPVTKCRSVRWSGRGCRRFGAAAGCRSVRFVTGESVCGARSATWPRQGGATRAIGRGAVTPGGDDPFHASICCPLRLRMVCPRLPAGAPPRPRPALLRAHMSPTRLRVAPSRRLRRRLAGMPLAEIRTTPGRPWRDRRAAYETGIRETVRHALRPDGVPDRFGGRPTLCGARARTASPMPFEPGLRVPSGHHACETCTAVAERYPATVPLDIANDLSRARHALGRLRARGGAPLARACRTRRRCRRARRRRSVAPAAPPALRRRPHSVRSGVSTWISTSHHTRPRFVPKRGISRPACDSVRRHIAQRRALDLHHRPRHRAALCRAMLRLASRQVRPRLGRHHLAQGVRRSRRDRRPGRHLPQEEARYFSARPACSPSASAWPARR